VIVASLPKVETFATIDSTNAEAKRRAVSGQRGPIWLRADSQTAGIGRSGREWYSPNGNLYATLLTPFAGEMQNAALMSFVACLAVADTLEYYLMGFKGSGLRNLADDPRITLKWPNDALLDGKKIAGVLLEAGGEENARWLAIGVGINLAHKPDEARWPPIALTDVTDAPAPAEALNVLAGRFEYWQSRFETEGFAPIRKAWLSRAARLGERIEARLTNATHTGIFQGLGEDGALLLAADEGDKRIAAADIYFPYMEGV